ncbi:hypothetical protein W97_08439 [Coniosporium apollinis CBS 100218]|uniref:Uncharacterized protein n=1 Tax=Coniosporium apollinis (strain CBS 100218) TaxID=1168221 RepID=R7Z5I8_CONA1|nr:uncharacterized protein W97_08439 [Coniosporium apollinis CBS 100218]EON69279.1 hypothetical protein W97_08439 [Coniosporium apollinis CBS 100218]
MALDMALVKQQDSQRDKQPHKQLGLMVDLQEGLPVSMELAVEAVLLLQWVGEEVVPVAKRFMASRPTVSQLTDNKSKVIQLMDSKLTVRPSTASQLMARTFKGSQFMSLLSERVGQEAHLAATLLKWAGEGDVDIYGELGIALCACIW